MNDNIFAGKTIAFIGAGNMAEAIIGGMISQNLVTPRQIVGYDVSAARLAYMQEVYDIDIEDDLMEACMSAGVVILAIKPQVFPTIDFPFTFSVQQLVVSIMAGTTIEQIEQVTGGTAIARSMPNTPAQIGEGMTVWTTTATVSDLQKTQAQTIFGAMGQELYVSAEKYLDMATAMNGSGPAYVFLMMEAMVDAGVQIGLARSAAEQLVMQTFKGSVAYANQSDLSLNALRNAVTSPGGTTAAALYAMQKAGLPTAIADGVHAAHKRAIELGQ